MLKERSSQLEIMDDLTISGEVIGQTLRELDTINRTLGGNAISISAFRKLMKKHPIQSVADLGCGGGDLLLAMANEAKRSRQQVQFTGVDANAHIVAYARAHTSHEPAIRIENQNIFDTAFQQQSFDVIHCCLFLHHFTEEELVGLFTSFRQQARVAIIVNDLQRHWLAYQSIKLLTRLFSRSYMVRHDAAVSVARGFTQKELKGILAKAGIKSYSLRWRWAFRWELVVFG